MKKKEKRDPDATGQQGRSEAERCFNAGEKLPTDSALVKQAQSLGLNNHGGQMEFIASFKQEFDYLEATSPKPQTP